MGYPEPTTNGDFMSNALKVIEACIVSARKNGNEALAQQIIDMLRHSAIPEARQLGLWYEKWPMLVRAMVDITHPICKQ